MHLHVNTSFMFMGVFVYETFYGKFGQILYFILLKSVLCWPQCISVQWFYLLLLIVSCMVGWRKKSQSRMFGSFFNTEKEPKAASMKNELLQEKPRQFGKERNKTYKAKPILLWIFLFVLTQFPSVNILNLQNSSFCPVVFLLIPFPVKIQK